MKSKNLIQIILSSALVFVSGASSLYALPTQAGVNVGNASYYSREGKFGIQYDSNLSLVLKDHGTFEISNKALINNDLQTSRIEFSIQENHFASEDAAETSAKANYPGRVFVPTSLNGVRALVSEISESDHLDGLYIIASADTEVVAKVNAYAAGGGLELVAPIIKTYAADTTPPDVQSVRSDSNTWTAGSRQTLYFHATDDLSGPNKIANLLFYKLDEDGNMPGPSEREKLYRFAFGEPVDWQKLKSIGNGWYAFTAQLGQYLPGGDYVLDGFSINDAAGNSRFYGVYLNVPRGKGYAVPATYDRNNAGKSQVPVFKIKVINSASKTDTTPPMFRGYRPDFRPWTAGSRHRVYFRVTDDLSGWDMNKLLLSDFFSADKNFSFKDTGSVRSEGNGWYSRDFTLPLRQPSGIYNLAKMDCLKDRTGNGGCDRTQLDKGLTESLQIRVDNRGNEDRALLQVDKWSLESSVVQPGHDQRLRVHFTRQGSPLTSLIAAAKMDHGTSDWIYQNSTKFSNDGDGWYTITLPIGSFVVEGSYSIDSLQAINTVGNLIGCQIESNNTCNFDEKWQMALPKLVFTVAR